MISFALRVKLVINWRRSCWRFTKSVCATILSFRGSIGEMIASSSASASGSELLAVAAA